MLIVSEQYAASDTGRQRRANEDSMFVRSPLFVVADGMGGAQAGEVASRIAVEYFQPGVSSPHEPEAALAGMAQAANARIHELSHASAEHAGMGTTLTAVYVGAEDVAIAHVGDSRAYCLRDGELLRLTDDHSLVDELLRQGRLTPEEALEHPQRSVITRALGPEEHVEVDTRSFRGRDGDVYLVCSDGLTTMLSEAQITVILSAAGTLAQAGEQLIAAANEAGGRDNITVLLLRLQDVVPGPSDPVADHTTMTGMEAVPPPPPPPPPAAEPVREARAVRAPAAATARGGRIRRAKGALVWVVVTGLLLSGAYLAMQYVYFIGTNSRGLLTIYQGLPYKLPGNIALYQTDYVSGVGAASLPAQRRTTVLDHTLRSEGDAAALIRSLELGQVE